jgi:hypothetical protein
VARNRKYTQNPHFSADSGETMRLEAGIHRVTLDNARTLRAEALENGWQVF